MISVKNQGMEYEIAGLNCLVTKKKIKNLYIRIRETDGKVLVNVPTYISDKKIREFVLSHKMWIHEKQQEVWQRECKHAQHKQQPLVALHLAQECHYFVKRLHSR